MTALGWRRPSEEPIDVPSHGPSGYNRGCRCDVCRGASRERRLKYGRSEKADWLAKQCRIEAQEESQRTANHHRRDWSYDELQTALDYDLSAREAAVLLGRTYYAVQSVRRQHRKETNS